MSDLNPTRRVQARSSSLEVPTNPELLRRTPFTAESPRGSESSDAGASAGSGGPSNTQEDADKGSTAESGVEVKEGDGKVLGEDKKDN